MTAPSPSTPHPNKAGTRALRKLLQPMLAAAEQLSTPELHAAVDALLQATPENCPWYVYALRHDLRQFLVVLGGQRADWMQTLPPEPPGSGGDAMLGGVALKPVPGSIKFRNGLAWLGWAGGPCPAPHANSTVQVVFRNGATSGLWPAGSLSWLHCTPAQPYEIVEWCPRYVAQPSAEPVWQPWPGGPCPVNPEAPVWVQFRDTHVHKALRAEDLRWGHTGGYPDIVWWSLPPCSQPSEVVWQPWGGGQCPVPPETPVWVRFRNGAEKRTLTADHWDWAHNTPQANNVDIGYEIVAWRVAPSNG